MYPTHEEIAKSLIKAADNFEGDLKEEGTVGAYDALFEISEAMGIKFNADYSFILRELSKCIDPTATGDYDYALGMAATGLGAIIGGFLVVGGTIFIDKKNAA